VPDVGERFQHRLEDLAARTAAGVGDESDPTGIALSGGVMELWVWCAHDAAFQFE
jgi:hypothetical protein